MKRQVACATLLLGASLLSVPALAEQWQPYADPGLRYQVQLPVTSFQISAPNGPSGHLALRERDGDATIDIYTGGNAKHLSPANFANELAQAGAIKDLTYSASGGTWFVISGHYASGAPPLIYYAKYVFAHNFRSVADSKSATRSTRRRAWTPLSNTSSAVFGLASHASEALVVASASLPR